VKHNRDIDTNYFYNPIVHGDEEDYFDGGEGATGDGSDSISLSILTVFISISCISCFFIAPITRSSEGSYIQSVLGQDTSVEPKKEAKALTRWKVGPTMRPGARAMCCTPSSALRRFMLTSSPVMCFLKKMMYQKDRVLLTPGSFLKLKNTRK
jgi:hypothetical protein